MKKLVLVLIIGLSLSTGAFADHKGFGIGIVGGGYWGGGSFGYPGLSLKIPVIPIFWGIYIPWNFDGFGLGLTGDFYIIDSNLVGKGETKLDWYLGLGGFINMYFWPNNFNFDFGLRVPIGLSLHIIRQLELFLDIYPGLGFWFGTRDWFPVHFFWGGEIGLRLWFR